jgi:RNA polymerase sigma factor (sigma-70 family)
MWAGEKLSGIDPLVHDLAKANFVNDAELLARFVRDRSGESFAELVRNNTDIVYSAARRQANPELAEEITQAAFVLLWRKAGSVKGTVAGWLIRATWLLSRNARRLEIRRQYHERRAAQMRLESTPEGGSPRWEKYSPVLDEALASLGEKDRDAIALRYFKGLRLAEVGQSMSITEEAARKRVSRATDRLRGLLAQKAAAPSANALAEEIAARAVVAAPLGLSEKIATAGVAAINKGFAAALVHGAGRTIFWVRVKIAATILLASGIAATGVVAVSQLAGSAATASTQSATPPGTIAQPSLDSPTTGEIQLARWDVVLDQTAADAVRRAGHPVASQCEVYDAMTFRAADLRQIVISANATSDLLGVTNHMEVAAADDSGTFAFPGGPTYFNYSGTGQDLHWKVWAQGGTWKKNDHFKRTTDGSVHIALRDSNLQVSLQKRDNAGTPMRSGSTAMNASSDRQAIVYDGLLQAGDAIAFLGKYTGPRGDAAYHLVAWEAFRANPAEMKYIGLQTNAGWWCLNTPTKLNDWARAAVVWEALGKKAEHPAEMRLADGKLVNISLSRPSKWPFCWWDSQGKPVDAKEIGIDPYLGRIPMMSDGPARGLWALIQVRELPPVVAAGSPPIPAYHSSVVVKLRDNESRLNVGFTVGDYKDITTLKPGEPKTVDGIRYVLQPPADGGNNGFIRLRLLVMGPSIHAGPSDTHYSVSAVRADNDPDEIDAWWLRSDIVLRRQWTDDIEREQVIQGISLKDVKYFRLMSQRRQWVTIANLATNPSLEPKTNVTDDEVSTAEQSLPESSPGAGTTRP